MSRLGPLIVGALERFERPTFWFVGVADFMALWGVNNLDGSPSLSLDDPYLAPESRAILARPVYPMVAGRGVPGTHDVALGEQVLDDLIAGRRTLLPRFNNAADRSLRPVHPDPVSAPVDVAILEGWYIGASAKAASDLIAPINDLGRERDPARVWREYVNRALVGPYERLLARIHRLRAEPGF